MCQAAHRHMVAQGGGKIVNIGSLTGLQPVPLRGVYSATKAAVLRLSDALRIELAPLGVQVAYVAPGFIATHARTTAEVRGRGGWLGGWMLKRTKPPCQGLGDVGCRTCGAWRRGSGRAH